MKNNVLYAVISVVVVMVVVVYMALEVRSLKSQLIVAKSDLSALKDTVRIVKTKNGELETVRLALVGDKQLLRQLSDSLYKEVQKEKGNVKYIVSSDVSIKHDTLVLQNTIVDSTIHWSYSHKDSGGCRLLSGVTTKTTTKITQDELDLNIITGLKQRDDKKLEIFIRSKYPGVTFTNIEGAVLDPEKPAIVPPSKWFSIGPCISAIVDPTGAIRVGVGVSVQWSLIKF